MCLFFACHFVWLQWVTLYGDIIETQFHVINGTKLLSDCYYDGRDVIFSLHMYISFSFSLLASLSHVFATILDDLCRFVSACHQNHQQWKLIDRVMSQYFNAYWNVKFLRLLFSQILEAFFSPPSLSLTFLSLTRLNADRVRFCSMRLRIECTFVIVETKISIFIFPSTHGQRCVYLSICGLCCGFFRLFSSIYLKLSTFF